MSTLRFSILRLLRPLHWVKNGLIFLPMLLAGSITRVPVLVDAVIGFLSFSLMASAGYILNDIVDVDRDRRHPYKSNRPLAAASLSTGRALGVAVLLLLLSVSLSWPLGMRAVGWLMVYFTLNWLYSAYLKPVRFFDIVILSSFYLIRLFYGSAIGDAELTGWFVAASLFSFISLSANKRYLECAISKHGTLAGRGYSKDDAPMLQTLSVAFALGTLVLLNLHAFFVLSIREPVVIALINLFAAGMMFSYFGNNKSKSDDPVARILSNPFLLAMALMLMSIYVFELMQQR